MGQAGDRAFGRRAAATRVSRLAGAIVPGVERGHRSMAAIPSFAEEDARRPGRERESLVGERTRLGNRIKGTPARLGIRGFKPAVRRAAERLALLRTAAGMPLPPDTLAEPNRDLTRLCFVGDRIAAIEAARLERLRTEPDRPCHPMILLPARVIGVGIETADRLAGLFRRCCPASCATAGRRRAARTRGRPDRIACGKRRPPAREGPGQGRQCPRASRHAAAGLALPDVPEGLMFRKA